MTRGWGRASPWVTSCQLNARKPPGDKFKEEAKVTAALAAAGVHLEKLGPWRRVIERTAFSTKDKTRRDELLKVAGYGLGQVESPKEAKEFLANIKPLVEMRKEMLLGRGLAPAVVDFPVNTLAAMESESKTVAKEKAEAALAGTNTRRCRAELTVMLDRADDSVEILVQQSLFLEPAQRKAVEDLSAEWLAALNEARVLTRKRVEQGDVPPSLVDGPSTTPPATTPAGTPG
ncbi:MAG: hypothetical protein HY904_10170 [Deltaproteobacteria bacterium]|nr:hypothetical protein [Deltaproteobacteria bacterium]